jgi:hypothetical protein
MSFFVSEEIKNIIGIENKSSNVALKSKNFNLNLHLTEIRQKNNSLTITCDTQIENLKFLFFNNEFQFYYGELMVGKVIKDSFIFKKKKKSQQIKFKVMTIPNNYHKKTGE